MAKSETSSFYTARLALFEAVVATVPGVERKGDILPYTSMNGNMCGLLANASNRGREYLIPPA
jgi:hypothetical protein